ncbi:MAG: 4-hydroxy-tetrahydrodipicolinate synthase [Polyangiaceae bacterium]|nr:4-hydroxy-tetrahydrodipicolinate synthase [Polyangiaceae bacterium]MCW5791235.1 4-hydroxy-tetrahydrodipicolinate synthase [Polyangiaceae bacterium]
MTPFSGGEIDYQALGELIERQVEAGVTGVVPCGSTGESATLSHEEHERLIAFTVERASGRVQVIAGTGSNSTSESVRLTRFAKQQGATGALLIAPYYNKPTQEGLYAHYAKVAESVDLPQLVYNIPGRSAVNITPETMARLAELPHVVGVKEASGSLDQVSRIIEACGEHFTVLSGDDSLTLPILAVGGRGVIAVVSNLAPRPLIELVQAAHEGSWPRARQLHYQLLPLMRALGLETNPIPVKAAIGLLGWASDELRLPLTPLREACHAPLRAALVQAKLLPDVKG